MKEFVEKLIERLEELKEQNKFSFTLHKDYEDLSRAKAYSNAIEIVKDLASEHNNNVIIDEQYCWQTCGSTEHCKECRRLSNGDIDYYENYDFMVEEHSNGWIPCSERLPEISNSYLVTKMCENDENPIYETAHEIFWTNDKKWDCERDEYCEWKVTAWQNKLAPYKKGE